MTLFEILNFNRELLERLAGTGYKPDDYKYIDLYKEYEQMRRKGEKVTYCVASVSYTHLPAQREGRTKYGTVIFREFGRQVITAVHLQQITVRKTVVYTEETASCGPAVIRVAHIFLSGRCV